LLAVAHARVGGIVYGEGSYRCANHGSVNPAPRQRNDLDAALRATLPALR
jgi:hypothetical protein